VVPPRPSRKGELDARELISLYPLLLPPTSSFTRCHPPLHPFADLNHLAQGDAEKVLRCKRFLISYLGAVRMFYLPLRPPQGAGRGTGWIYPDTRLDVLLGVGYCKI